MNFLVNTEFYVSEETFERMAFRIKECGYSLEASLNYYETSLDTVDRFLFKLAEPQIIEELKENYL